MRKTQKRIRSHKRRVPGKGNTNVTSHTRTVVVGDKEPKPHIFYEPRNEWTSPVQDGELYDRVKSTALDEYIESELARKKVQDSKMSRDKQNIMSLSNLNKGVQKVKNSKVWGNIANFGRHIAKGVGGFATKLRNKFPLKTNPSGNLATPKNQNPTTKLQVGATDSWDNTIDKIAQSPHFRKTSVRGGRRNFRRRHKI